MVAQQADRRILEVLARSVLFAGWPPDMLAAAAQRFRPLSVTAGTVCCREGEVGDEMYIVEDGRFAVDTTVAGQPTRLAELGPGAVFGEMAVVTGQPRTATVRAETDGGVWALRRADLQELTWIYPALATSVDQLMSRRRDDALRWRIANENQTLVNLDARQGAVSIGRAATNQIALPDSRVSREHAVLRPVGDTYEIVDLNSTNGTFVNGQRVTTRVLQDGDEIWIGSHPLNFNRSAITRYSRGSGTQVDAVGLTRVVGKGVTILNDVWLSIYPGELVCIVGGSGAGKSTLLTTLSGLRAPTGGRTLYNGFDLYRHFDVYRQSLGYVPQDDIVHLELTVYQTLYYTARLRLPDDTSREELEARIEQVLDSLALRERRDTQARRLSGGQRKRVSIGVELLTEPEVFYLDEPTSGLDPGLDKRMMDLLRSLANQGRTVITTTHATRNIMICDKVVFMAPGGYLAFFGSPHDALTYFEVEEFADIYGLLEGDGPRWQAKFRQSALFRRNVEQRLDRRALEQPSVGASAERKPAPSAGQARTNQLLQLLWLTSRYFRILWRDPVSLVVLLAAAPAIALLLSLVFGRDIFAVTWDDGGDARQAIGLLFNLVAFGMFLGGFVASRSIAEELPIYLRERLVNLRIAPYVLSKVCALGLFALLQAAALTGITALRVDLPGGNETLAKLAGTLALANLAAIGIGMLMSSLSSNGLQATLLMVGILLPQLSLSGAAVALSEVSDPARWLSYGMIGRWALSLLGYYTDLNARLDAQYPRNDYADQFNVDPTICTLILVGFVLAALVGTMIVLRTKDAR